MYYISIYAHTVNACMYYVWIYSICTILLLLYPSSYALYEHTCQYWNIYINVCTCVYICVAYDSLFVTRLLDIPMHGSCLLQRAYNSNKCICEGKGWRKPQLQELYSLLLSKLLKVKIMIGWHNISFRLGNSTSNREPDPVTLSCLRSCFLTSVWWRPYRFSNPQSVSQCRIVR